MKNKKEGNRLSKLESQELMTALPEELQRLINRFPENRRRPVNKIIDKDQYFYLIYNLKDKGLKIKTPNLVYSTLPKDTDRLYIQRAAFLYLEDPQYLHNFIKLHRPILEVYFKQAISILKEEKYRVKKSELDSAYNDIFKDPLFEIQIMGRLISHDEEGASLEDINFKFLYSCNKRTGISNYIRQYLQYVKKVTSNYEITTDGINVNFYNQNKEQMLPGQILLGNIDDSVLSLTSEKSTYPATKAEGFPKVLPTYNNNQINVVSDIHAEDKIPFTNKNFNILAGDISEDSLVKDPNIKGIIVIGNWDILVSISKYYPDILFDKYIHDTYLILNVIFKYLEYKKNDKKTKAEIKQIASFLLCQNEGMSLSKVQINRKTNYLLKKLDEIMNDDIYQKAKNDMQKRFPKMKVLNNESLEYQGVRYVGLTLPMNPNSDLARIEYQDFIYHNLKRILKDDVSTPTVIISHAPLFNELSLLSSSSKHYDKNNICIDARIKDLFHQFNIIGVIHGHHHIRATSGRGKNVLFANKRMFVICSIYSDLNTGYDLEKVLAHL